MMKPKFTILLLFFSFQLFAQNSEIDSLRTLFRSEKEVSEKLKLYIKLADAFHVRFNADSTLRYTNEGIALALEENDELIYGHLLYIETATKNSISRQDLLENYTKVAEIFSRKESGKSQFDVNNRLIELYANFGNHAKVKYHAEISTNILDTIVIEPRILLSMKANFYLVWGFANTRMQNYDNTISNFKKAKTYFEEIENHFEVAKANFNISIEFTKKNELDSAETYMIYAKNYFDNVDHDFGKAMISSELGALYVKKDELTKGIELLNRSVELCEKLKLNQPLDATYSHLGAAYAKLKDYKKAIYNEKKSLELGALLKDTSNLILGNKYLSGYYEEVGDYRNSLIHHKEYVALKESKLEIENKQMLDELETKYQVKEKEDQIEIQNSQLKQQRNNNIAIGIVAGLLLLLAILIWRTAQQRKQTNTQLKRLDRAKSSFFTNISHELRTPLTLILAPLEEAMQKVKSNAVKTDLKTAHSNGKKLLTLVNEIMDLSKLESGEMKIQATPVNLESLLRRIFFSYHSLGQIRDFILSFSYHLPKDLVVKIDVDKFEKVVNNLLSNAFKYSNPGGVITLRASDESGNLKIEVQDTGRGIAPSDLDKIFDRFYQSDDEDEPLQGGTGIGLAYAREIAHLFKGNLEVESELGKGSNFIFTLPMKKSNQVVVADDEYVNQEHEEETNMTLPLSHEKQRILIVEDNPEMSGFLNRSLSHLFHCSIAYNGAEALAKLDEFKPDLITSDVMMPSMDGFSFLEKLRSLDGYKKIPTILLTARALEEDKLHGFALGVDDYLTKPFSTRELIARIQNLLRNKNIRETSEEIEETTIVGADTQKASGTSLNHEEQFLKKAEQFVLDHLSDNSYKVSNFANDLNYSTRQLERILKKLTGFTPVEFIREIRLQRAYALLNEKRFATVAEVRYHVGIENASHFTRKFRERFGINPGEVGK